MKVSSLTLFVAFASISVVLSSSDQLRGGSLRDDDIGRSQQFFPMSSFPSFVALLLRRFAALVFALPAAVIEFIRFVWLLSRNFLVSLVLFLLSPITPPPTTTTSAPTTTSASITMSFSPMITSTPVSSAATATVTGTGSLTAQTGGTAMSSSGMSTATLLSSTSGTETTAMAPTTESNTIGSSSTSTTTLLSSTSSTSATTTTTTASTTTTTQGSPKTVFVTSESFNGNLGGLEGGDMLCADAASKANLTGMFLAWLSNSSASPSTRFTKSTEPYVKVNGTTFANSYDALVARDIVSPLNVDESGQDAIGTVWTGTVPSGSPSSRNCDGWNADMVPEFGGTGSSQSTEGDWTGGAGVPCSGMYRLYCFEQ